MAAAGTPRGETGIDARLGSLRGRLAAARALEDLQPGLAAGAGLVLLLGTLVFLNLLHVSPLQASAGGICLALSFPIAGLLLRRTSARRVANLVDERLGLAERVGTALALRTGEAGATPLSALVLEDAARSLDGVAPAVFRRAFRPRILGKPLAAAGAAALLALFAFQVEPLQPSKEKPLDPAAAYRERKEKEDAARAARRILEEAKKAEELSDPRHAALRAVAAEMRRQAEEMLRQDPRKVEAMAGFQKMGEMARERQEQLAGLDPKKLQEFKAGGQLSKMDPDLERLLSKLLGSDLKGLNDQLSSLDRDLKGGEGAGEWSPEQLAALKDRIDQLAEEMRKGGDALGDRAGLKNGLSVLGDPKLLKEISDRLGKLMDTLKKQGWKACQGQGGLKGDGTGDFPPGEPIVLSDAQLQAMIDRLKELQELADLGQLATCQNCGLAGGT